MGMNVQVHAYGYGLRSYRCTQTLRAEAAATSVTSVQRFYADIEFGGGYQSDTHVYVYIYVYAEIPGCAVEASRACEHRHARRRVPH